MNTQKPNLFVIGSVVLCSIVACGTHSGSKTTNDSDFKDVLEQADTGKVESFSTSSLKSNTSKQSILYLDCSKSMAGYIEAKNSSVFNNVIAGLLYRNDSSTAHLFDLKEQTGISRDSFIDMVNNKRIHWSSESNLGKMISAMADNYISGRSDISFLITDGIMSGTDVQIRNDREYNKTHYGYSQEEIESVLKKCGPNVSVLVVQYLSGFTTNSSKQFYYYCYDNSHVELSDVLRPFYIIAIGKLEAIKELSADIQHNARLSTFTNTVLLGDAMPYKVDFKPAYNKGASFRDGFYTVDKGVKSSDFVYFNLNLSLLQDYMISEDYVRNNGQLFFKSSSGPAIELSQDNCDLKLTNSTLTLGIQSEKLRGATLSYRIKYHLPQWIESSSSPDDKNVAKDISPKTFNLKYFIDALAIVNKKPSLTDGIYINQTDEVKFK